VRGYDAEWRRFRAWFLGCNPLCVLCLDRGVYRAATVVDHIVSVNEAPERRLDPANCRALCKPCHDRRTAAEQGFGRRTRRRARA
jgi:5-methylcytosine-specific restriction protein A